jgi:hypothetical protein
MAAPRVPKDGELRELALDELRPDHFNPRFPPHRQGSFGDDEEVYRYVDREFDAFHIADSIRRHGYFPAEPMIAMPASEGSGWTVLEGNRRLTALKGLVDPSRRENFPDRRWRDVKGTPKLPAKFVLFVVRERAQVAPILGFRHITGIAEWDPYAQARYIAQLVDDEDKSLDEVADLIGRKPPEVKSAYRNYWIVEQARNELKVPDVERALEEFGVWTRAMQNPALRSYIEAPDPRDVDPAYWPLPGKKKRQLGRLLTFLFGGPRNKNGQRSIEAVLSDSRQITLLGRIIESERGRAALEAGADLETAELALEDPYQALQRRLEDARDALAEASTMQSDGKLDAYASGLVEEISTLLDGLRKRHASSAS